MITPSKPITIAVLSGLLTMSGFTMAETVNLRVIETSDLHGNIMAFDYYKNKPSQKIGLARAATLIRQARNEVSNSVLVDDGDLIQGSPMADYIAAKGLRKGDVHPIYKAMNLLNYDVATIGNHEFNYGLDFLKEAINDADFPYINANVYDKKTGQHYFKPYLIKEYLFQDNEGNQQKIKVGYIGFVPPQVMVWDRKNLTNNVIVKDIVKTAEQLVPEMKKEGADVIIALAHSGISGERYQLGAENEAAYLATVKGIDAIASGHSHANFPGKRFANIPGVDLAKGTINGVATTMPGHWGSDIGVMDLVLDNKNGDWEVVDSTAQSRAVYNKTSKTANVKPDQAIVEALQADHNATQTFVNQPIGKSSDVMYSYLALVQDDPTIQIVNAAQKDYVEHFIQGNPELALLPVLSAAAPFKAGGRKNDPTGYTEIESGQLTFRNAADLYLYPNTLVALKVTGKEVQEWLECSAGQFKQIDVNSEAPQSLIDWENFRTYNFDVIDGVKYQIDVTQAAKYDGNCKVINPDSQRIVDLTYQGKAISMTQDFLIATNNYRAYGEKFAGTGSEFVAFDSPDENRSILAAYISNMSKEQGEVHPSADYNWSFAPIHRAKKLDIRFETAATKKADTFIKNHGQYPMQRIATDDTGFAVYQIDLQK